ncbi:MAG: DNA polymerase III subunit alpha [Halanaerobiales bacterium]|nr:DNA polymerase III subunit alpha [Halanaerobiales bacterium]
MVDKFVHLHNHTEYSLLDGALRLNNIVKKAKKLNMPAVAVTDHGVLYGMYEFYKIAKNNNIKPIIGCEVYLSPTDRFDKSVRKRYHLLLLAINNQGLHNLMKIVSASWLEGFYYKPRVDKDLLYKYRKGIIASSACLQGEIPQAILNDKSRADVIDIISEYKQIFGKDNFYLELMDHNLKDEKKVNSSLIKISNNIDVPMIITNDVHYENKEDADVHDVLLALQTGKTIKDENRMRFPNDQFYFKSSLEMYKLFPELENAYKNTLKISNRVNINIDNNDFYLPSYPDVEEKNSASYLKKLCEKGLKEKGLNDNDEALERMNYELEIIEEMGYISYFLIVWDFIKYAEKNNIRVGPGRGSAAGSLVSYLLGITRINPLKYGLIFERFLNPQRVTMPDIDIDFDERRDEIIEYVKKRYGNERVAQIGTFGTMAARAAVRDVGRALDISYGKVDKVAKMIPAQHGINLDYALKNIDKLNDIYKKDDQVKKLIDYSKSIEGLPRHISTHAAGVIIGPEDLKNIIPLQLQDGNVITQLPMNDLEAMGLLKMDFLGLRNLTIINKALALIEKNKNITIDIENIARDDQDVYKMLQKGQTSGVFQMESRLFQDLNKKLKPDRFEDIIALLALGRPGPLGSNIVDDYIKCRHGEKEPDYIHPKLKPILKETYGMILYQEQVMEIASKLAGYSMGEADLLRRGMGKKKKKLIENERNKFIEGALNNGIKKSIANDIFDQMEYFAGYGFNKSHSAAYALLAYQTAYLKAKYPSEFMAALLSSVMNNLDKVSQYINEAKDIGLDVLPPDINESYYDFVPNKAGDIRFGLKAIKNVGTNAIETIVDSRKDRYKSLEDFLEKIDIKKLNIRTIEALIKSGCFDNLGLKRSQLLVKYEEIYEKISNSKKQINKNQTSFFDMFDNEDDFFDNQITYPDIDEIDLEIKLEQEKEYLGIYVSGHPLDDYKEKINLLTNSSCSIKNNNNRNLCFAGRILEVKQHYTKNNNLMAFLLVEDWETTLDVVVFPDTYKKYNDFIKKGNPVLIVGYQSDNDSFIAKKLVNLKTQLLEINLSGLNITQVEKIKSFIVLNKGNNPVILKNKNKKIISDKDYWINLKSINKSKLDNLISKKSYTIY